MGQCYISLRVDLGFLCTLDSVNGIKTATCYLHCFILLCAHWLNLQIDQRGQRTLDVCLLRVLRIDDCNL
jgi:hypothetical protein